MKYEWQQRNPLETLRKQVDLSPYAFPPESPQWLNALTNCLNKDLGALAILGPSGLDVRSLGAARRITPDPLTLSLAALVNALRQTGLGRHVALGLPPGARHLPLLFATSSILADALLREQANVLGQVLDGLSGVLVISKDLDIRSRYCDLCVQHEPLDNAYPGSRMRPDGELIAISSKAANNIGKGVCFFSPGQNLPRTRLRPCLVIIDFRYGILAKRVRDIAAWACNLNKHTAVLAIYTQGDRDTCDALNLLKFDSFPIDHEALAGCAKLKPTIFATESTLDWNVLRNPTYLEREHQIICVDGEEVEKALIEAQQMIQSQLQQDNMGLNRARWLCATLSRLPVPPIWYEKSARSLGRYTLARLIDKLAVHHDAGMGVAMQSLKMQFESILLKLQVCNPRAEKLRSILPSLVGDAGEILILVRDEVSQRALQNWLELEVFSNARWLQKVEVRACSNYFPVALKSYPLVLVNGAFPRRYSWIAGGALGDTVTFLSYSTEVEAIGKQLEDVYGDRPLQERANARERFFSSPAVLVNQKPAAMQHLIPKLNLQQPPAVIRKIEKPTDIPKPVAKNFRDLPQVLETARNITERNNQIVLQQEQARRAVWEDCMDDESQITDLVELINGPAHEDDVPCYRFEVQCHKQGKKVLWLAKDQLIECIRKNEPDEISEWTADELSIGDTVILVEESARGSLFDRVVRIAENQPELQYLAAFRRQWQEAMKALASKYDCDNKGYWQLYNDLRNKGSNISTTISVRNWVLGHVMGPTDISSIIAAGRLTGIASIERNAKELDNAFRTIRTIHQTLGRRLTRTIYESSRYLVDEDEGEEKKALWLPVNEILDTVELAEICVRAQEARPIPPQVVGRLLTI